MTIERDDYDVFLDSWEPDEALRHASLSQNLDDPFIRKRFLDNSAGIAPFARTRFSKVKRSWTPRSL